MTDGTSTSVLVAQLHDLRARLAEAEEVLGAIRSGEVDALVVGGENGEQVYTLSGADRVYRQLIETMSEGAVTLSADGVILFCNACLAELLGRPLDLILGTVLRDYLAPADQTALDAILAQARSEPARREINLKTREGLHVPVYLSATRLHSEGAEMVFCLVLTNLTEQKRHEQIVAAERLARLILEQAAGAIVVCDEKGRVTRASLVAQQFCDGSPLLRPFAEVFPLQGAGPAPFELGPVLQGETLRNVDVRMERLGKTVDFILTAGPLLNGEQILGCVVTLTNITERKRAAKEHEELQEQFRSSQKMEAIGSLAGGVAHDFNNLLSVILSYTEFAASAVGVSDPIKHDLLEVQKAGERAAGLTRQLLAFSRKQVLQPVVLNLNQIAVGIEKMLRRILGEDIDYLQILAPDLGLVRADPGQVEQVLMNLVVNARDAMPEGGKLTIETSNVEIDEEYAARHVAVTPGAYVQLTVTDSGTGMDPQTKARLFEPFFTTKEKGKGTGLGLSTVYGIVKQSGGNIWVYSEPGHGTTFKIYLPHELAATAAVKKVPSVAKRSAGNETILVVEDEEALRKIAVRALVAAGYTVLVAGNGEEALDVCRLHGGDLQLLLTDVVMPRLSGGLLAQELMKERPGLKVLYMSGYTDDAIVHHGVLEAGGHFLGKPFVAAELTRKVREVLDNGGGAPVEEPAVAALPAPDGAEDRVD